MSHVLILTNKSLGVQYTYVRINALENKKKLQARGYAFRSAEQLFGEHNYEAG